MAAYVIVDIEVTDPTRYAEYVKVASATVTAHGGKYLTRGGRTEVLEGSWTPKRFVILEFNTLERAKEWWDSEDYRGPKALRQSASITNMIVAEGL